MKQFFYICCIFLIQSCALHSTKHLYKCIDASKITKVRLYFSDSVNNKYDYIVEIDTSSNYIKQNAFADNINTLINANKSIVYINKSTQEAIEQMRYLKTQLLIEIYFDKNSCTIFPYHKSMQFWGLNNKSTLISIGRVVDILYYSKSIDYTDNKYSNNFINFVNKIIEYKNDNGGVQRINWKDTAYIKVPLLPLIQ